MEFGAKRGHLPTPPFPRCLQAAGWNLRRLFRFPVTKMGNVPRPAASGNREKRGYRKAAPFRPQFHLAASENREKGGTSHRGGGLFHRAGVHVLGRKPRKPSNSIWLLRGIKEKGGIGRKRRNRGKRPETPQAAKCFRRESETFQVAKNRGGGPQVFRGGVRGGDRIIYMNPASVRGATPPTPVSNCKSECQFEKIAKRINGAMGSGKSPSQTIKPGYPYDLASS